MPETKISQDVRQDHKGRNYRVEYYAASGRVRQYIYVDDATHLPKGYTVPAPIEPVRRPTIRVKPIEPRKDSVAVVQCRYIGKAQITTLRTTPKYLDSIVADLRAFCRIDGYDPATRSWKNIYPIGQQVDWMNQYHEGE